MSETASTKRYRPETKLVHSGALRSQFGETSEALFLTQGFIYDSAEQCEARFKGEDPGFLYSRFSNPNISMFERRMIELEGAEAARATATGMASLRVIRITPFSRGLSLRGYVPGRRPRVSARRTSASPTAAASVSAETQSEAPTTPASP